MITEIKTGTISAFSGQYQRIETAEPPPKLRGEVSAPNVGALSVENIDSIPVVTHSGNFYFNRPLPPRPHSLYTASNERFFREGAFCDLPSEPLPRIQSQNASLAEQPEGLEDNRLVNTCKSPTQNLKGEKYWLNDTLDKKNARKAIARIYARDWSGEFRLRVESMARECEAPAPQMGDRWTDALTERSARKIIDSGAYVQMDRGGYNTFLTLTFRPEQKARVERLVINPHWQRLKKAPKHYLTAAKKRKQFKKTSRQQFNYCPLPEVKPAGQFCNGERAEGAYCPIEYQTESTIGQEVSRFFDAAQKTYQRGWVWDSRKEDNPPLERHKIRHEGHYTVEHSDIGPKKITESLDYVWVAEAPEQKTDLYAVVHSNVGPKRYKIEQNHHVHVLMRWQVLPQYFRQWARRIENIWGKGFANLKRIYSSQAATGYLLKALGYLTKGRQDVDKDTGEILAASQGRIRGNRYNISQRARAPDWQVISEYQAERMGQIVFEWGQKFAQEQAELTREARELNQAKKKRIATRAKLANSRRVSEFGKTEGLRKLAEKIEAIEARLSEISTTRAENEWGAKYQVTFRNDRQLKAFLSNAITKQGWQVKPRASLTRTSQRVKQMAKWANEKRRYLRDKAAQVSQMVSEEIDNLKRYWQQVEADMQTL